MPYADPEARRAARARYEAKSQRRKAVRDGGPGRSNASRNGARTIARTEHVVRFVGVDGEGVDRPDGAHDYNLLSIGDESLFHADGRRLGFDDVMAFLWDQHCEDPGAVMVGFYLGYDFAQWLRDLPDERARMLLTPAGQAVRQRTGSHGNPVPFPVRWGGWEFDLLPNLKRFKLRPTGTNEPWLYVCDTGSLFQSSFVKAIDPATWPEPVCSRVEYATIVAGKAARQRDPVPYGTKPDAATIAYNTLENRVLSRLMDRYNRGLVAMGVKLTKLQWHGPGQAAQAWLKQTAPGHTGPGDRGLKGDALAPYEAAQGSYFGGWFEIMAHGIVPGETHEYDINSAYPTIIAGLPCLLHGQWEHGTGRPRTKSPYRLVYASLEGSDPFIGAMPHRKPSGGILRPHSTAGWYWQHELEAARRAGLVDRVRWHEWWQYRPCECAPPFRAIRDLYRHRLGVGKNSPEGRAAKLVYNSSYGKMAQSVGRPLFGNPVYASLITAGCRAMILDAIATHPGGTTATLMVATDGVYFTSPHPGLDLDGQRLGAWDSGIKTNLSLFKPGMYWDDKARKAARSGAKLGLKSRGVNEQALAKVIDRIDRQWPRFSLEGKDVRDPGWWPSADIVIPFTLVSPRQALNRGKWHLAGTVEHNRSVRQSSAPHKKRKVGPPRESPDDLLRTRPHDGNGTASTPYDRRFGMELREAMFDAEMIIPDGEAHELLAEILGMR